MTPLPSTLGLDAAQLARVFPFHFGFDRKLEVVQLGALAEKVAPRIRIGARLEECIRIRRPAVKLGFEELAASTKSVFLLEALGTATVLKGQVLPAANGDALLFLGTPWVTKPDDLAGLGLFLTDLPPHDPFGDFLFLLQAKNKALEDSARLHDALETHRRSLEETVRARTRELQLELDSRLALEKRLVHSDRLAAIGQLAAGVAHEVNNPLSYVIGNIDYLIAENERLAGAGSAWRDFHVVLAETMSGAQRIRRIVHDLQTFARADEDEARGPVDVASVVEASIALVRNELNHVARLVRRYGEVPAAIASEQRLVQVLVNLLVNATHAIPEGTEQAEISIGISTAADGRVAIDVQDNGTGVAPEHRARIFDPFFTTKGVGKGTGLGLSMCHGLVVNMGGAIEFDSPPEGGSRFRVLLQPADEAARAAARSDRRRQDSDRAPSRRVLIVDDDAPVAASLRRTLRGHDVAVVTTGQQAVDSLVHERRDFDVILCDLMMPDVTGMDVFDAVRAARPILEERFVFVTGGAFTPRAREFVARVANPCVEKPFDGQAIREMVRTTPVLGESALAVRTFRPGRSPRP